MEKRFRKLGKSLSPSGFGLGSKAPPSKRTRSQTKNSSVASGLTTSQQTLVPQSGSEPLGNFQFFYARRYCIFEDKWLKYFINESVITFLLFDKSLFW